MTEQEIRNLPEIIGVKEVARILNIGRDADYRMVKQDNFQKTPLGERTLRFSKKEVLEFAKIK